MTGSGTENVDTGATFAEENEYEKKDGDDFVSEGFFSKGAARYSVIK